MILKGVRFVQVGLCWLYSVEMNRLYRDHRLEAGATRFNELLLAVFCENFLFTLPEDFILSANLRKRSDGAVNVVGCMCGG
jgi:hypothetical protein